MKYGFEYRRNSPYGNLVELMRSRVAPGVVIDIGCGNAPISGPLTEMGFHYVGVDLDPATVAILQQRGIEAHVVDLTSTDSIAAEFARVAAGHAVSAITALDVIEHLTRPLDTLQAIHRAMTTLGATWLGVSIPNVAHSDLAGKLLAGKWDITPTGLLDDTHVSLFTEARLRKEFAEAGFREIAADDFHLFHSDQAFPAELPTVSLSTTLGRFVRGVRSHADPHATTNQFIRLYELAAPAPAQTDAAPAPFLTVMVRTQGSRPSLVDTLTCLAAQTCADFEVLLLVDTTKDSAHTNALAHLDAFDSEFRDRVHVARFRTGNRVTGLNHALEVGRGRYFAALDDDDLVFANWVEEFRSIADAHPGCVVRVRTAVQRIVRAQGVSDIEPVSGFSLPYHEHFDWLDHLSVSQTPLHSVAFPGEVFRSLGVRYNPELEVYEDLDVLLKATAWCGVRDSPLVTAIYRRWDDSESTINQIPWSAWEDSKLRLLADLDRMPLLLPEQSATRLFHLVRGVQPTPPDPLLRALQALRRSKLWKLTTPFRAVLRRPTVRKLGRRVLRRIS